MDNAKIWLPLLLAFAAGIFTMVGIFTAIGIGIHNFPEGMAVMALSLILI